MVAAQHYQSVMVRHVQQYFHEAVTSELHCHIPQTAFHRKLDSDDTYYFCNVNVRVARVGAGACHRSQTHDKHW